MKTKVYLLILPLFLSLFPLPAAENLLIRKDYTEIPKPRGKIFLDPDQWQRQEIAALQKLGATPVAWLNVSCVEPERVFSIGLNEKIMFKPTAFVKPPPGLALFYDYRWKEILRKRVLELGQKGFDTLLLTGLNNISFISDHPILKTEMAELIKEVSQTFKKVVPNGKIYLHHPPAYLQKPFAEVDGIVWEGLYFDSRGRANRLWKRKNVNARLKSWLGKDKDVVCVENAITAEARLRLQDLEVDVMIASLPLQIGRIK